MARFGFASGAGAVRNLTLALAAAAVSALPLASAQARTSVNVTTYHYDNYRTGWNQNEIVLSPTAVLSGSGGQKFELLKTVALDDQVDAQPLLMTGQSIAGGTHDVVYVATENNSIYAIDAQSGQVLLKHNYGPPVTIDYLPGGCTNNANDVGIGSTPVIDPSTSTMYFINFQLSSHNVPVYHLHAVDLSTLKDIVSPVNITASATLTNNKTYKFNPQVSRQRSALLLANGNVYAGFASYCDSSANLSRGWVLGWQTGTLTPLAHNEMTNKLATDPDTFFLSSIWMSGYGLASGGPNGDIYFVTGNSDYSGTTIDGVNNIAESVVQMSSDLSTVKSIFTPSDAGGLDQGDTDYGSGGALLLPPQTNQPYDIVVAAGKEGNMFLLDADNLANTATGLGESSPSPYGIGGCWCGESYYTDSTGHGRVVASGSYNVSVWGVTIGKKGVTLSNLYNTAGIPGSQDPGFMTAVSSNGTTANSGVIWSVSHADGSSNEYVWLTAFNATGGKTIFSQTAGTWPNTNGNANLAPVVANGLVYVASYQQLAIFGMGTPSAAAKIQPIAAAHIAARATLAPGQHEIYGIVKAIKGYTITVQKRDGSMLTVDATPAAKDSDVAAPSVGHGILVRGTINASGVMLASVVLHAKDHSAVWLPDR